MTSKGDPTISPHTLTVHTMVSKHHPDVAVVEDIDIKVSATGQSKEDTVTAVLEVNGYKRHDDGTADIEKVGYISEITEAGEHKFHKLSWFQLVIVLVVAAVALGTLSMPV